MASSTSHPSRLDFPHRHWKKRIAIAVAGILLHPAGAILADTRSTPVTVAPLESLYIYPATDAPAHVVSLNDARVSAETPGVLMKFDVEVGDKVHQDDTVASINCEEHEINSESAAAAVEAAQSRQAFAQTQLTNARQLSSKKGIARETVDERRSAHAVAAAELDQARATLKGKNRLVKNCKVSAPFSGIVIERIASVGDYVTVGTSLIRLVDTTHIEVAAQVQEQDIPSLKEAVDLDFIDRYAQFPLQLRTVLPVMESRLRSFETRLAFKDNRAASGTTGRLRWKSPWPHLPYEYLVKRGDSLGIFVLSDDTASFRPILEARPGKPAKLTLPANTLMIVEGRHSLRDGDPVSTVQSDGK